MFDYQQPNIVDININSNILDINPSCAISCNYFLTTDYH
jgi:hypothetical protein